MKKTNSNIDQNLEFLSKIERAEVSPFLKTRIDQIIENGSFQTIKPKWAWGMMFSFVLVLAVNIVVAQNIEPQQDQNQSNNYNSYSSNNTLY